jgi:hypothetical protein
LTIREGAKEALALLRSGKEGSSLHRLEMMKVMRGIFMIEFDNAGAIH